MPELGGSAVATPAGEVTLLLQRMKGGDPDALPRIVPLVYKELRRLAGHYMRGERIGHTLQPTALVHEAYLRLVDQTRVDWQSRAHFLAVAAQMMRRILVNHAVQRKAGKRTAPAAQSGAAGFDHDQILAVDEALKRLCQLDAQQGRVVEMRYFGGLTEEETAKALGMSPRTVRREWATAKLWLRAELEGTGRHDG